MMSAHALCLFHTMDIRKFDHFALLRLKLHRTRPSFQPTSIFHNHTEQGQGDECP